MKVKAVAIAAIFSSALATSAQGQRSIRLALGGGASFPTGQFDKTYSTGGHFLAGLIAGGNNSLVGVRLDYSVNTFTGRDQGGVKYRNTTIPAVIGSLVGVLPIGTAKPYVIAGGGWYPYREATDTKRDNDFGLSGGVGVSFPCLFGGGFIEARYHDVFGRKSARQFAPVTFGLLF